MLNQLLKWVDRRLLGLIFLLPSIAVNAADPIPQPKLIPHLERLLLRAKNASPDRFQFAMTEKVNFLATSDQQSFYLYWQPSEQPSGAIVTLHGSNSFATDEFFLWQPYAKQHNLAIIAVQWWLALGENTKDYYSPYQIYPILEEALVKHHVPRGKAMLHGFSRGSANAYAVTALDRYTGNHFFALTVANSGGASMDYQPNVDINQNKLGERPFSETHWLLYCGEQDENPERSGCPAMQQTQKWLVKLGGTIDQFIQDKEAGHGGFHHNPLWVEQSLQLFQKLQN